jgi:hypothetical protein
MPLPQFEYEWIFTSTGNGTRQSGTDVREWTFHIECPVGSTGIVEIQGARDTTSTTVGVVLGSSQTISSSGGAAAVVSFSGPLGAVFPRVVSMTVAGQVVVRGIGN